MGSGERKRVTVDDIKAWANIGLKQLLRPEEPIEYTVKLEPYDQDFAVATERVRTTRWSAICMRRGVYVERYPAESMIDPDTKMYDNAGTFRMLGGTAWHGLPVFNHVGGIQEVYLDHEGVTGHIDWWIPEYRTIIDTKLTGWIPKDPRENNVYQVAGYYAEHNLMGVPTEQVFIWYVDRCLKTGSPLHQVFEIVFDHNDHEGLPPVDPAVANRFQLLLPDWNIDHIWNEIVQPRRQVVLDGRKGILPPRMPEYDDFNHWLCQRCPYRPRCRLDAL